MEQRLFLLMALALAVSSAQAQTRITEHVLRLDEGSEQPAATLDDVAWLAGAWTGEAFGGTFEEVWTHPAAGSMVGLFKLVHDGAPTIYELQTITEEDGSLLWKVRHFDADFTAWEEKAEFVRFPLVAIDESVVHFDGLTLLREGENLVVYLTASRDGETHEEKLIYAPMTGL